MKYNVYKIEPDYNYSGFSLVAAENVEEANKIIQKFKSEDEGNTYDSYGYSFIEKYDIIYGIFPKEKELFTREYSIVDNQF